MSVPAIAGPLYTRQAYGAWWNTCPQNDPSPASVQFHYYVTVTVYREETDHQTHLVWLR